MTIQETLRAINLTCNYKSIGEAADYIDALEGALREIAERIPGSRPGKAGSYVLTDRCEIGALAARALQQQGGR